MDAAFILDQSRRAVEERRRLHEAGRLAAQQRQAASQRRDTMTHRTRRCPACGQGLKMRYVPAGTLVVCPGCSFARFIDGIHEGVPMTDEFVAGVTSIPRGRKIIL